MHLVLHSDRGTLWISRSLWATRPTSEPVLFLCCLLHTVCSLGWCLLGLELCYTCVVVLHTVLTLGASWVWSEAPPHLSSCVIKLLPLCRPYRSSPPRNYEYFVGPRCIQAAPRTSALCHKFPNPKNSLALWFGGAQV